jgi:mannose-6-phosphate isomerase
VISPYPLLFEPILMEKVWGGRRLERFGKTLPAGKMIGESWELADLSATSASGAGGQAARSVITSGPLKGRTLHDAIDLWRRDLMGEAKPAASGDFPLLIKFLDACENLSVQVHPSPAYARAHEGAHLKTECWYILAAEPVDGKPAVIYKGIKPGVTPADFAGHIEDGSIVNDMVAVPAVVGECHNLPSGTCHALGAGVLVAEVQTPSDTTFRVFDWGRTGRELHVRQAMECIDFGPAPAAASLPAGKQAARLVSTDFFRVFERFLPAGGILPPGEGRPRVLIVLSGTLSLRTGNEEPVTAGAGVTVLVPASIAPRVSAIAKPGTRILEVLAR